MWEKLLLLSVAFGGMLLFDGFALRGKLAARDKLVYGALLAISLYAGIDLVINKEWPDFLDLANLLFGKAAKALEQLLEVNWEQ